MENEKFWARDMKGIDTTVMLGGDKTIASIEREGIGMTVATSSWEEAAADQVSVVYKGKEYLYWDEFPEELQNLVKNDEHWRENKDVTVQFEPEMFVSYDGFDGSENYGHEVEDERMFFEKSKGQRPTA